MAVNMKKVIGTLGLAAFVSLFPAYADSSDATISKHDDHHHMNSHDSKGMDNYPQEEKEFSYFVAGYYTYWVPYFDGTYVAMSQGVNTPPGTKAGVQGNVIYPKTFGRSGFKVAAGAKSNYDDFMFSAEYTWFDNPQSMKLANLIAGQNYFTFEDTDSSAAMLAVQSRMRNNFNRINGTIDKMFFGSHYVSFRPWFGIMGAWDRIRFDYDADTTTSITFTDTTTSYRYDQEWWGVGPYTGVDCTFYFTDHLALAAKSGLGLLYGNHQRKIEQYMWSAGTVDPNAWLQYSNTTYVNMEPMLEGSLGAKWDRSWDTWGLAITVEWQIQSYFEHVGVDPVWYPNVGDIYSMQGLTVGARFCF